MSHPSPLREALGDPGRGRPGAAATAGRLAARPWRRQRLAGLALLGAVLVAAVLVATSLGSARIPLGTVWAVLLSPVLPQRLPADLPASTVAIVLEVRLPRVVLAGLVGGALALAGATYQGVFRNPLADPYLLGVASGAAVGASIGMLVALRPGGVDLVPLLAFGGAMASVVAVYLLGRVDRRVPPTTLVLAGVAVASFLSAVNTYLMLLAGERVVQILSWLLGGLTTSTWSQVHAVLPYLLVGGSLLVLFGYRLNVLQLDEEQAKQLGVDVDRVRLALIFCSALVTAAAVSVSGTIGFVGLVVPHVVRLLWGPDYRTLLPLAALAGASFLILADTVARTVLSPTELPVGAVTAFVGAPFFVYLLRQRKREVV
ncbi:MAG TPA: iron ABC transporter permease [Chloroflexota bacterium]